jgi:hypothetical protein
MPPTTTGSGPTSGLPGGLLLVVLMAGLASALLIAIQPVASRRRRQLGTAWSTRPVSR